MELNWPSVQLIEVVRLKRLVYLAQCLQGGGPRTFRGSKINLGPI